MLSINKNIRTFVVHIVVANIDQHMGFAVLVDLALVIHILAQVDLTLVIHTQALVNQFQAQAVRIPTLVVTASYPLAVLASFPQVIGPACPSVITSLVDHIQVIASLVDRIQGIASLVDRIQAIASIVASYPFIEASFLIDHIPLAVAASYPLVIDPSCPLVTVFM